MADWDIGTVAENPDTGEVVIWNGRQWEPRARNLQPFDAGDKARLAEMASASAATSETAPLLDVLRTEFQNPNLMMGGGQNIARAIDEYLPGDQGMLSTPFTGGVGGQALINRLNQQKDIADRIAQANTRLSIPLASMLKPISNQEIRMVQEAIGGAATSREAALAGVRDMTFRQSQAVWRDRKAREWRQAYGSLGTPADRGYDTLAATPGETFDQYFARWSETNKAALENPQGRTAQYRPLSRAGEVDTATGRLRSRGQLPPVPRPPTAAQDEVQKLLQKYAP